MTGRESFQHYLEAMLARGFRPSSALGQNFLLDPSLHRWLVDQADVQADEAVVEIGVGLGFLTRELAARARRVVAVEIDGRLLEIARQEVRADNVQWLHGDALGGPGGTLLPAIGEALAAQAAHDPPRFRVVANLPYSVSGPLLAELCAMPVLPVRAVLLLQKEVAQRVAAGQGASLYGGLSATVQATFAARVLRDVPPHVFRPRPKVVSAVLQLDLRPDRHPALAPPVARREYGVFVRQLFQQRRKVLRTTLPRAAAAIGGSMPARPPEQLARRAEELGPDELVRWWIDCRAAMPR